MNHTTRKCFLENAVYMHANSVVNSSAVKNNGIIENVYKVRYQQKSSRKTEWGQPRMTGNPTGSHTTIIANLEIYTECGLLVAALDLPIPASVEAKTCRVG